MPAAADTPKSPRAARPRIDRAVVDADRRRADLAAIHATKARLGWDDDTYRDIMFAVCRERSAAQLDFSGRKRFLAHMQVCLRASSPDRHRPRPPWTPQQRLAWSLWQQICDAGLATQRGRTALDAWIKRQAGPEKLEWLNTHQLDAVIRSLRQWLARAGGEVRHG